MSFLFIFISLAGAYVTYSPKEAMSACAACLDKPQARFCLNAETSTYTCCGQGENSILCNPGGAITCSSTGLQRYRFCPTNQQACDSDESLELFRSEVPLLSNTEDGVDVYELAPGSMCIYEVNLSGNQDSTEILEIEVVNIESARVGVDFVQRRDDGTNLTVEGGFWSKDNCTMEVNCTVNMRGKHVYYLSGVQSLHLTVIAEANASASFDIDFYLREKTTSVVVYLASSFALLFAFGLAYQGGIEWMRQQMQEEEVPPGDAENAAETEEDPLNRRGPVNKLE